MSSLKSIGQLIRVPIEQVELTEEYDIPAYYVGVLAETLKDAEVRNWVPVIVQEQALREFRVVENGHIFDAMRAAGQEYVWVVVIPDDPQVGDQVSLLMGKSSLKVNLCTASYEMILSGLSYLIDNPAYKLNTLPITLVAERILQDSSRFAWTSLQPLTKLGFKPITTAKLKVFAEVFEAKPEPIEIRPVVLNTASASELLEALYAATTLPDVKLGNVDLKQLATLIAADPNRQYWTDLMPLTKLKAGITKAKLAGLDQVFHLHPVPIRPVALNTASASELLEAIYAATTLPNVKLGDVDLKQLATLIAADPDRQYWTDLMPLTKLNAGITKAKLAGLDQVFHLNPIPTPEPNTVPYLLNLMAMSELKSEAKKRGLTIPKGAKKPELVELLSASPS